MNLSRQNSWVNIEKSETGFPIKKSSTSPSTNRTQFSLAVAWAYTVHKFRDLSTD